MIAGWTCTSLSQIFGIAWRSRDYHAGLKKDSRSPTISTTLHGQWHLHSTPASPADPAREAANGEHEGWVLLALSDLCPARTVNVPIHAGCHCRGDCGGRGRSGHILAAPWTLDRVLLVDPGDAVAIGPAHGIVAVLLIASETSRAAAALRASSPGGRATWRHRAIAWQDTAAPMCWVRIVLLHSRCAHAHRPALGIGAVLLVARVALSAALALEAIAPGHSAVGTAGYTTEQPWCSSSGGRCRRCGWAGHIPTAPWSLDGVLLVDPGGAVAVRPAHGIVAVLLVACKTSGTTAALCATAPGGRATRCHRAVAWEDAAAPVCGVGIVRLDPSSTIASRPALCIGAVLLIARVALTAALAPEAVAPRRGTGGSNCVCRRLGGIMLRCRAAQGSRRRRGPHDGDKRQEE